MNRLARLDACGVSDACDGLGVAPSVSGIARYATGARLAGRVITVKLGGTKPEGGTTRHLCTAAIDAARPGDIIVVEQRTGMDAGSWGGVLSNAAQVKGVQGVICEGPARDIDESRALGFPVFARGMTARTARGRVYEVDWNCAITVGDVTVNPGDLVIADASGVVFLPQKRAAAIIEAAERITQRERLMADEARKGTPASQVMGRNYETLLESSDGQSPKGGRT